MKNTTTLARIRFLSMKGESSAPRSQQREVGNGTSKVNDHVEGVKRFEVTRTILSVLARSLAGTKGCLLSPMKRRLIRWPTPCYAVARVAGRRLLVLVLAF